MDTKNMLQFDINGAAALQEIVYADSWDSWCCIVKHKYADFRLYG